MKGSLYMSTFSSYEKDKKIFDNWRQFVLIEQEQQEEAAEYSKQDVEKTNRKENAYVVNSIQEVQNLGQLMFFVAKENKKLGNQWAQAVKNENIQGLSQLTLGVVLAVITGPLGALLGTFATEAILKTLNHAISHYQVNDAKRESAPIYQLFDLHDGLKNLIKYWIRDKKMEPAVRNGLMTMLKKLFINPNPDTWADTLISEVVEKLNAEKLQWQYADQQYGLVQYRPGSEYAKVETQPKFK